MLMKGVVVRALGVIQKVRSFILSPLALIFVGYVTLGEFVPFSTLQSIKEEQHQAI